MSDFSQMDKRQRDSVQIIVCDEPSNGFRLETVIAKCEAGCGRTIGYPSDAPVQAKKICVVCMDWVTAPQGSA